LDCSEINNYWGQGYIMTKRWVFATKLLLILCIVMSMVGRWSQPAQAANCLLYPPYVAESERFGVNVVTDYGRDVDDYAVDKIRAAWYLDYQFRERPLFPEGMAYLQMLKLSNWMPYTVDEQIVKERGRVLQAVTYTYDWQSHLGPIIDANPGMAWIIGNEPDRAGQDGREAWIYAINYHDAYFFIKQRDPSATVIVAAMVQATPVRMRYLDLVLSEYQRLYSRRMPIEYWNIHGFILREEIGNWGASIPPAPKGERETVWAPEGVLYEVEDHGDIEIFKSQVIAFRQWMAQRGYRDTPLMVSEYGILLPDLFQFKDGRKYDNAFVREYMLASFDFLLNTKDENIGFPLDDNRLVQTWSWYSLNEYPYNADTGIGFNGNLFDHDSAALTPLGADFGGYAGQFYQEYTEVQALNVTLAPPIITTPGKPFTLTVDVTVVNRGNLPAQKVGVRLWRGDPTAGGQLIDEGAVEDVLAVRCSEQLQVQFNWPSGGLTPGLYDFWVEIYYENDDTEYDTGNNMIRRQFLVGDGSGAGPIFLPLVIK
jgi:hypothetical protein